MIVSVTVFSPAEENFVLYVPLTALFVVDMEPGSDEFHVTVNLFVSSILISSETFQSMETSWFCVSVTAFVDARPVELLNDIPTFAWIELSLGSTLKTWQSVAPSM